MQIAITGHRPNKLGNDYALTSDLIGSIKHEIMRVLRTFEHKDLTLITGMALGIDTLFAKIAIEHNIPFIAAIPFKGQEIVWPEESQETYRMVL